MSEQQLREQQLREMVIFTEELAEQLLEEEGVSVPDVERFVRYVWLVQSYPLDQNGIEYYRENLRKWADNEEESYYGEHESVEEFTRHYIESYAEAEIHPWICIDYERTWDASLRHTFTAEDNGRGVWIWADVY